MRRWLACLFILTGTAATAVAQSHPQPVPLHRSYVLPQQKSFSVEVGTGIKPLHMFVFPGRSDERALAEKGQEANTSQEAFPALSLTGILRTKKDVEWVLTGGVSWGSREFTQYPAFGIDPEGKPRFDLSEAAPEKWFEPVIVPSLTLRYRTLWNPDRAVVLYSEFGLGLFVYDGIKVLPAVTLLGARYGGRHLYFFLENTYSPVAALVHGGLGWRF